MHDEDCEHPDLYEEIGDWGDIIMICNDCDEVFE